MLKLWISAFKVRKIIFVSQVQWTSSFQSTEMEWLGKEGPQEKRPCGWLRWDRIGRAETGTRQHRVVLFCGNIQLIEPRQSLEELQRGKSHCLVERSRKFVWKEAIPTNLKLSTEGSLLFVLLMMISWRRCFLRKSEGVRETQEGTREMTWCGHVGDGFKREGGVGVVGLGITGQYKPSLRVALPACVRGVTARKKS